MSAIYLSHTVMEQIDDAQAVIDRHLIGCVVCAGNRRCGERRDAEAVFLRYGRLPRRRPGLTNHAEQRPDGGGRGWFESTREQTA